MLFRSKEQIEQLEAEIAFAEKLVYDESLIFQDDLFGIILKKAKAKGHSNQIEEDTSSVRDYVVSNILDNRAIETYHTQPVNEVVDELIEEYFQKDKKPSYEGAKDKNFYEALSSALKSKANAIKHHVEIGRAHV